MTGTFGGALEARGIAASEGRLTAEATGEVELEGRILVLKRVHVAYRLVADPGVDRQRLERVLNSHPQACPVYRSIHPQIEVSASLQVEERA